MKIQEISKLKKGSLIQHKGYKHVLGIVKNIDDCWIDVYWTKTKRSESFVWRGGVRDASNPLLYYKTVK